MINVRRWDDRIIALLIILLIITLFITGKALMQKNSEEKIKRVSSDVLNRSAIKRVLPPYTNLARLAGVSGKVIVEITVDEEGKVISVRPLSGDPILQDSTAKAVKEWRFKPIEVNGIPIKVIGTLEFEIGSKEDSAKLDPEIEALRKEAQTDPNSVDAHYKLATAYKERYLYLEAIEEYRKVTYIKPDFIEAYFELGEIYYRQKKYEDAIEAYKQAAHLKPDSIEAYCGMGWSYEALKKFDESEEAWKKAMSLKPDDLNLAQKAYLNIAGLYKEMDRSEELISVYRQLISIAKSLLKTAPGSLAGRPYEYAKNIAGIYEKTGRMEESLKAYKEGVGLASNEAEVVWAYSDLGDFLERLGRINEAIETYRRVIALHPKWSKPHFTLARLYLKAGRKESALEEYRSLKKIDPEMGEALLKEIMKYPNGNT
ncbi:MAG: TonB family protein [Acidobacteriota bacterium]